MDQVDWVDADEEGVAIRTADYQADGQERRGAVLVRTFVPFSPDRVRALAAIGFVPVNDSGKLYGRPGRLFRLGEMRTVFPRIRIVPVPRDRTNVQMNAAWPFAAAPGPVAPRASAPVSAVPIPGAVRRPLPGRPSAGAGQPPPVPAEDRMSTVAFVPRPEPLAPAIPGLRRPVRPPGVVSAPVVVPQAAAPSAATAPAPVAVPQRAPPQSPEFRGDPEERDDPADGVRTADAPVVETALREPAAAEPAAERTVPVQPRREAVPGKSRKRETRKAALSRVRHATGKPREAVPVAPLAPRVPGERLNRYQVSYRPASGVGVPIATIPINLAAATERALERLQEKYGPIDAFVSSRLDWTIDEMAGYLSPEQVDAVGLAIAAAEKGQGFVLADQTGLGKGRVVAAIARGIVLMGKVAIVTTEKENLFSDLFRDIADIGSLELFGRPFILNANSSIIDVADPEGRVIHEPWKPQQIQDAIKRRKLPKGTRMVLSTYSQFNRVGSPKIEFLKEISKGNQLVCDESHNAVGDSNTSLALSEAMALADGVTYSSATFAKNARNLAAYGSLFPPSMRSSDLMGVLSAGGQSISEALAQMLAEDGAFLRREHDLSGITIQVVDDMTRIERNRAYADAISPVLGRIAKLARIVSQMADERNGDGGDDQTFARKGKASKEFWYTGNFGARLAAIVRQFVTALQVDFCVDEAVAALDEGEKPVIVIESTMESLMRELASDDGVEEPVVGSEIPGEGAPEAAETAPAAQEPYSPSPPDFKDALRLMLDRTMQLIVKRAGEEEPERIPVDDPELVAEAADILSVIEGFPDLSLSPIDDIRARVEEIGRSRYAEGRISRPWAADEISARSMRVLDGAYVQMPKADRVSKVAGFNAGLSDLIVITRAASTGLSLHASERVKDQRKRRMIELQIPANVVERVQFWGRINRRGQVVLPSFRTLSTGLPLQTRLLAIQNRKVADLSANVTASAESATAMDVPDPIDAIGNEVCRRILEERPILADRMHIAMKLPDPDKAAAELYHVNKLLSRLILLGADEQEALYAEVIASYEDALRDLAARGRAPRGSRDLDGVWNVVDRQVFEPGDERDGPVFGRPVMVTTIESEQDLAPLSGDEVQAMVDESVRRLACAKGASTDGLFAAHLDANKANKQRILNAALPAFFASTRAALASSQPNAVKLAEERLARLASFLNHVKPGLSITVPGDDGAESGVIVDVRTPPLEDSHLPGRWGIRYVVPGDERPREISAAAIIRDPDVMIYPAKTHEVAASMLDRFARTPVGRTLVRRKILDGNLVKAVVAARHVGWSSAVNWTGDDGVPRRAVLIPRSKQDSIAVLPGRTTSAMVALDLMRRGAELSTNPDSPDDGARMVLAGESVDIFIPGAKKAAKIFETPEILAVVGRFKGDFKGREATVPASSLQRLIQVFAEGGHAFHFEGRYRSALGDSEDLEDYSAPGIGNP